MVRHRALQYPHDPIVVGDGACIGRRTIVRTTLALVNAVQARRPGVHNMELVRLAEVPLGVGHLLL